MKKVIIKENKIFVGNEVIPLLSGEIHYWRLNPNAWSKILSTVTEMGIKVISTYIPWQYHELRKGEYDFEGKTDPQKGLLQFFSLVESKGFWLIVRPGPYIYSEWVNAGIPTRVTQYHRLHPSFLKEAEGYIRIVCKIIKPHLATKGGHIILVQADNEINPSLGWYEEQQGLGKDPGLFQNFLKTKYGNVRELNRSWGGKYAYFRDCRAIMARVIEDDLYWRRWLDFREYIFWYVQKYAQWVVEKYRENGIDVPIYLNTSVGVEFQNWRELQGIAELVGIDAHPSAEFSAHSGEHRQFLEAVRYAKAATKTTYLAEFGAGVGPEYHYHLRPIKPNHYRMAFFSALAGGAIGWNWYMLVNRDNWHDSPINEWGRKRPLLFETFKKIVELYKEIDIPSLKKLTSTAATFSVMHRAAGSFDPLDPTLENLYQADIDYEFFDLEKGEEIDKPLLFYSGPQWLSQKGEEALVRYVEKGGNLILFKGYPRWDEERRTLELLHIKDPEVITSAENKRLKLEMGNLEMVVEGSVFDYEKAPGYKFRAVQLESEAHSQAEMDYLLNLPVGRRYVVGYRERRLKGSLVVLGVSPTPELMVKIHQFLKVPIPSRSLTPGVISSLFQRDKDYYLFCINITGESKSARIQLETSFFLKKKYWATDFWTGEKRAVSPETGLLIVDLKGKDGAAYRISPSTD